MKHLRFVAFVIPFFSIGCASALNQINPGYKPVAKRYLLPATIEWIEYTPTGTTRKIPLRECIGNDCRTIRIVDANEVMVTYYLITDCYNQHLVYQKLGCVATANPAESHQRVTLKVILCQDGSMEIINMEVPR